MSAGLLGLMLTLLLGLLRTRLRNRWELQREAGQLRMQRSMGSVLRELLGPSMVFMAALSLLVIVEVLTPVTMALLMGLGFLFLMGYLAAVLRFSNVTFDLGADCIERGAQEVGRAREVQAVEFGQGKEPLRLLFRLSDHTEARWVIQGVDPEQASELAHHIGIYLHVAVRPIGD